MGKGDTAHNSIKHLMSSWELFIIATCED